MRIPALVLLAAAAVLTVSVRALQGGHGPEEPRTQTTYYANGRIESECAVRADRREGPCRRYFADGRMMAEGSYAEGKMEGEWTFWLSDGSVDAQRSGVYQAGLKIGPSAGAAL